MSLVVSSQPLGEMTLVQTRLGPLHLVQRRTAQLSVREILQKTKYSLQDIYKHYVDLKQISDGMHNAGGFRRPVQPTVSEFGTKYFDSEP